MSKNVVKQGRERGEEWWSTEIIEMRPGMIRLRGYPIEDLIGRVSFPAMIWLMLRGELPSEAQADLLGVALGAAVDHGPQAPSIAIARMAATCGVGINSAMASAVNVLGDVHGGAGEQALSFFGDVAAAIDAGASLPDAVTARLDRFFAEESGYVPGLGHRFHPVDPRAPRLLALVREAAQKGVVSGRYADIAEALESAVATRKSKRIPLNIDGATAVSRFARDHFALEYHVRRLRKHGIRLVSLTQDLGDDPMSVMVRQVFALFDEYQSKENAKHTLRAMQENARQGYWNGAAAPYGYRVVEAGQRGVKIKKKLAIDPVEAEVVVRMFRLLREGDGTSGPLGVKAVVNWLNTRGYRTRRGARWGIGPVHDILTRPTYWGLHRFNTHDHRTRRPKDEAEVVEVPVPAIIEPDEFEAVQALLRSRNPKVTPPRVVTGPILLTGVAVCASCGGGMTLRTGKSGRYRYYACSPSARQGKTACAGQSIPMGELDTAVTEQLASQLLTPERLTKVLTGLMQRQAGRQEDHAARRAELRRSVTDLEPAWVGSTRRSKPASLTRPTRRSKSGYQACGQSATPRRARSTVLWPRFSRRAGSLRTRLAPSSS